VLHTQWLSEAFPGAKAVDVKLITHIKLMLRLSMRGVIPGVHYMPSWYTHGQLY
jgi:hypothetical protein